MRGSGREVAAAAQVAEVVRGSVTVGAVGRVLKKAAADASVLAAEKLALAEARALAIVEGAEARARSVRDAAQLEGQLAAWAELAAAWMKLRAEEADRDARDLDRSIELARAMAERLLGEELGLSPVKVLSIAKQVLTSMRQARRIELRAHPDDAALLSREARSLGLEGVPLEIHADPTRTRGSLLVDTDLGTLDANVSLQLDRLVRALRDNSRPR